MPFQIQASLLTGIPLGYEIHVSQDSDYPSSLTWTVIPALLGFTFCPITRLQLEQPIWKPTMKAATRRNQVGKSKEQANPNSLTYL